MESYTPSSWGRWGNIYIHHLEFFFIGHLFIPPSLICLFNNSFLSVWTYWYLFYILSYIIQYHLLLLLKLLEFRPLGALCVGSCVPLTYPNECVACFGLVLSNSLLFVTKRNSRHIYCPSSRIIHLSREPWFLFLENGIRNQELG